MDKRTGLRKSQKRARRDLRRIRKAAMRKRAGWLILGDELAWMADTSKSLQSGLDELIEYLRPLADAMHDFLHDADFVETEIRDSGMSAVEQQQELDRVVAALWGESPTQAEPESR